MSLAGKIALITGVTAVMGENFAPHETANSLAPGLIRTRAVKRITPKEIEAHHHYILVKRLGEPEDIANAALFLASEGDSLISTANLSISVNNQVGL